MCALLAALFFLSSCGVRRPLMRPQEIPAYEQKQREKRERIEQEQRELEAIDVQRAATTKEAN